MLTAEQRAALRWAADQGKRRLARNDERAIGALAAERLARDDAERAAAAEAALSDQKTATITTERFNVSGDGARLWCGKAFYTFMTPLQRQDIDVFSAWLNGLRQEARTEPVVTGYEMSTPAPPFSLVEDYTHGPVIDFRRKWRFVMPEGSHGPTRRLVKWLNGLAASFVSDAEALGHE